MPSLRTLSPNIDRFMFCYLIAALLFASCQAAGPSPAERSAEEAGKEASGQAGEEASGQAGEEAGDLAGEEAGGEAGDQAARQTGGQAAPEPRLTAAGWGPLRIGMTREELVAAVGGDSHPDLVGGPEPERCDQFYPSGAPAGMMVMIEEGRLTRITLTGDAEVETEHGFGVGDLGSRIESALGSGAVASPHKYLSPPAQYVTVWKTGPSEPDPRGIVYETGAEGRVTHVHAGGSSIRYVEGCS